MISIEHRLGQLTIAVTMNRTDSGIARTAQVTPAGVTVVIGDGGWNPAALTLRCRVSHASSSSPGDAALLALEELISAARGATALHHLSPGGPHTTYVLGLRSVRRRLRGTWWEVELVFLPRRLVGNRGTGEAVTVSGQALSLNDLPVTLEVI
jgi:hypothetical protein